MKKEKKMFACRCGQAISEEFDGRVCEICGTHTIHNLPDQKRMNISVDGDIYRCKCGKIHSKYVDGKFCNDCKSFTNYRIEESAKDEIIIRMMSNLLEIKEHLNNIDKTIKERPELKMMSHFNGLQHYPNPYMQLQQINNIYNLIEKYAGLHYNQYQIYKTQIYSKYIFETQACLDIINRIMYSNNLESLGYRYLINLATNLQVLKDHFDDISMKRYYMQYLKEYTTDGNRFMILSYLNANSDSIITPEHFAKCCRLSIDEAIDIIKYMIITGENIGYLWVCPGKRDETKNSLAECAVDDKWIMTNVYKPTVEFRHFISWYISTTDMFDIYDKKII